jgi:hypothetical protein
VGREFPPGLHARLREFGDEVDAMVRQARDQAFLVCSPRADTARMLSSRRPGQATLEVQLPALVRVLEAGEAEAEWARKEEERRAAIRQDRWAEVKGEAFVHVA